MTQEKKLQDTLGANPQICQDLLPPLSRANREGTAADPAETPALRRPRGSGAMQNWKTSSSGTRWWAYHRRRGAGAAQSWPAAALGLTGGEVRRRRKLGQGAGGGGKAEARHAGARARGLK
jgi:hypothetical protein